MTYLTDETTKRSLLEMSQITVSNDAVTDMGLVESLREAINESGIRSEQALHGLIYLQLYHPSALVRHEAAFSIGDSGRQNTFLDLPALHDADPVVRHEACLAMGANGNRNVRKYRNILNWIAENDKNEMVRDSAKFAISRLNDDEPGTQK